MTVSKSAVEEADAEVPVLCLEFELVLLLRVKFLYELCRQIEVPYTLSWVYGLNIRVSREFRRARMLCDSLD
jgi:hypothetical protein